jgi:hypothetical protein
LAVPSSEQRSRGDINCSFDKYRSSETIRRFGSRPSNLPYFRVIAFNTTEGWARDVTEDVAQAVLSKARSEHRSIPIVAQVFFVRTLGVSLWASEKQPSTLAKSRHFAARGSFMLRRQRLLQFLEQLLVRGIIAEPLLAAADQRFVISHTSVIDTVLPT